MDAKEFKDQLAMLGAEPEPQTPAEFGRFINADLAKWIKLVKEADIKMPGGN
jgi:tripartite-type tricarboxylate transporter receptor subunit TctC